MLLSEAPHGSPPTHPRNRPSICRAAATSLHFSMYLLTFNKAVSSINDALKASLHFRKVSAHNCRCMSPLSQVLLVFHRSMNLDLSTAQVEGLNPSSCCSLGENERLVCRPENICFPSPVTFVQREERELVLNLLSICGFLFVSLDVVQQKQFINIRSVVQTTRRAPRSALRLWDSSSALQWINDKASYRNKLFTVCIFVVFFCVALGNLNRNVITPTCFA